MGSLIADLLFWVYMELALKRSPWAVIMVLLAFVCLGLWLWLR